MATIREILGDAYKEGMTFEEVESALNGKNLADLSTGNYVAVGKYNSAIAERDDFKSKYNAKLTEAERKEEQDREREAYYKAMERENSLFKYSEKLSATIPDKTVLSEIAGLMADGKFEDAFEKQGAYFASQRATIEEEVKDKLMKENPQAQAQNPNNDAMTREKFRSLSLAEKQELATKDPDTYSKMTT